MWRLAAFFGLLAGPASAEPEIVGAEYAEPTARYAHGVLGDDIEYGALRFIMSEGNSLLLTLPQFRVFEDIAPRLFDVDRDGMLEVIVVESDVDKGARLAIYDETGLQAATPFIGLSNRWL